MRVMGLVERDARLLDGGVELSVNGVAANGTVGDVLAPCEVEVGAGLLRLLPDKAEQGAPAHGSGGVEGLRLVRLGADVGLAAGAVDDGLAGEHLPHTRRPDAGGSYGGDFFDDVVREVAGGELPGSQKGVLRLADVFVRVAAAEGLDGLPSVQNGRPDVNELYGLFLLLQSPLVFKAVDVRHDSLPPLLHIRAAYRPAADGVVAGALGDLHLDADAPFLCGFGGVREDVLEADGGELPCGIVVEGVVAHGDDDVLRRRVVLQGHENFLGCGVGLDGADDVLDAGDTAGESGRPCGTVAEGVRDLDLHGVLPVRQGRELRLCEGEGVGLVSHGVLDCADFVPVEAFDDGELIVGVLVVHGVGHRGRARDGAEVGVGAADGGVYVVDNGFDRAAGVAAVRSVDVLRPDTPLNRVCAGADAGVVVAGGAAGVDVRPRAAVDAPLELVGDCAALGVYAGRPRDFCGLPAAYFVRDGDAGRGRRGLVPYNRVRAIAVRAVRYQD